MKIQYYEDIQITLLQGPAKPGKIVQLALNLTQHKEIGSLQIVHPVSEKTLKFLCDAGHGSVLEHINWTFGIRGVSRAFLAQITRHRIASYTSASQHYSDYSDMPVVIDDRYEPELRESLIGAQQDYENAVRAGVPIWEARMLLTNASTVNIIWTINARSLYNFMDQRMCERNVTEMKVFTRKLLPLLEISWPEFHNIVGPRCYTSGKCNQGRMTCGKPFPPYKEEKKQ